MARPVFPADVIIGEALMLKYRDGLIQGMAVNVQALYRFDDDSRDDMISRCCGQNPIPHMGQDPLQEGLPPAPQRPSRPVPPRHQSIRFLLHPDPKRHHRPRPPHRRWRNARPDQAARSTR